MTTYSVNWQIDIEAKSPVEAAKHALEIHRDQNSMATVFDVYDEDVNCTRVDLQEIEGNREGAMKESDETAKREHTLLDVVREFINDCEAAGLDHVAADWPDLIVTYKHAKAATAKISYWKDDPDFPADDWKYEVTLGNTRLGYHEWVEHERAAQKDESGGPPE